MNFKKLWDDYGIGTIIVLLIAAYGVHLLANYLTQKSYYEGYTSNSNQGPAQPAGANLTQDYGKVNYNNRNKNITSPTDLLPRGNGGNSNWLSPSGNGELKNVNLLRAGFHHGIDSIGQTLRNANLQIRSEPPNPTMNVGPWNNTTIVADQGRPAFEIGQGQQ